VTLANATTGANDARANESLTLIKRGSGAANEKSWKNDQATVETDLGRLSDTSLAALWNDYVASHQKVRSLDDGGRWDDAVKLSTSTAADGAARTFGDFDVAVTQARDDAAKTTVSSLEGLGGSAPLIAVIVAIAALVASWLVVRGIGQRIEEYR
jgi:hypothetical protein